MLKVEDDRLPPGWTKHMVRRSFGHSAGKWDVVLIRYVLIRIVYVVMMGRIWFNRIPTFGKYFTESKMWQDLAH